MPQVSHAVTVTWDANGATTGVTDGGATWSSSAAQWWNGSTDAVWTNGYDAVIGNNNGAAGTATVSGSLAVNSITFNAPTSGIYTVSSGTLGLAAGLTLNSISTAAAPSARSST